MPTHFPKGDTLGVVFSFFSAFQLLRRSLFAVSKVWNRVHCELPHAWGKKLDLYWANHCIFHSRFAWSRVTQLEMSRWCFFNDLV